MVDKKQVTATGKPGTVYVAGLPSYISAHHDTKGRMYFYNTITRVSAWDCNSLINQPADSKDLKFAVVNQTQANTAKTTTNTVVNNALTAAKKTNVAVKAEVGSPRKVAPVTSASKKRSAEEDDISSDGDNSQIEDAVKIGVLEKVYDHDRFPSKETREMLARELGMPVLRIETWFTRRRSRSREQETAVLSPKKRQKTDAKSTTRQSRLTGAQAAAAQRAQANANGKAMSAKQAANAASKRNNPQTMAQKVAAAQKKAIANIQERPEVIVFELLQELSSHAHKQMQATGTPKADRRFPSLEQLETAFSSCKPVQKIVSGEMSLDESNTDNKKFVTFDFNKLSICSYVRASTTAGDIKMKFNFAKHLISVIVQNEETKLANKMEIDLSTVDGIAVDIPHDQCSVMTVQLTTPPRFLKEIAVGPTAASTWISCEDFTHGQATSCRRITFLIPKDTLRAPLETLMKRDKRIKRLVGIGGEAFATNMYYTKSAKKNAGAHDIPDRLMDILSSTPTGDDPHAVEKLVWEAPNPTDEQGLPFDTPLPSLDGENIFSVLATMNSGDEDSHSDIRGEGMLSPGEFLLEKEDISDWLGDDSNQVSGSSTPLDQSPHDDSLMQDLLLPEEVSASV